MIHQWKSYVGLTETFDYCESCDVKMGEETSAVCKVSTGESIGEFNKYLASIKLGQTHRNVWNSSYHFDSQDSCTVLEFEDGETTNPYDLNNLEPQLLYSYIGRKFRFKRIDVGFCPAEWADDSTEIIDTAGIGGTRPNNTNGGNSPGTKYGGPSGAGLGAVSHSLSHRNSLYDSLGLSESDKKRLEELYEEIYESDKQFGVFRNNLPADYDEEDS